ncbi:hypothetical protein V5799_006954 [Amblyomma americanum]|uniref:RING-type domain-containing protein n=1 Tax=Amblyomma americanum TaxID=6943 RepID=A0AAQ4DUX8_AMBAM
MREPRYYPPPKQFGTGRGGPYMDHYNDYHAPPPGPGGYQNQQYEPHDPHRAGYAHKDPRSFPRGRPPTKTSEQRHPADTQAYWHSVAHNEDRALSAGESLLSFKRAVRCMTTGHARSMMSESGAYSASDARSRHGADERSRGTDGYSYLNGEELDHCEDDRRSISSSRFAEDFRDITNPVRSASRSTTGTTFKRTVGAAAASSASSTSMISVFWDIENCAVPSGVPAYDIVRKVRQKFYAGHREADFIVACDISRMNSTVVAELNEALVTVIHVPGDQKNAADEKLRTVLRRFSDAHKLTNSRIVLISGDVDFAAEIHQIRYRDLIHVVLIHNDQAKRALRDAANESISYTDFVAELKETGTKATKTPAARARPVTNKQHQSSPEKEGARGDKTMPEQAKKPSSRVVSSVDGDEAKTESTPPPNISGGAVSSAQTGFRVKVGLLVPKEAMNKEFWIRYLSNLNISQDFELEVGTFAIGVVCLIYRSIKKAKEAVAALSNPLVDEDDTPVCLGILSKEDVGESEERTEAPNLATKIKAAVSEHKKRLAEVRKKMRGVQSEEHAGAKQKKALRKLAAIYEAQLEEFMNTVTDLSRQQLEGDWAAIETARLRRASLVYSVKSRILGNVDQKKVTFVVTSAGSRSAVEIASYLQDLGKRVLSVQPSDLAAEQCAKYAGSVSGVGPVQCWLLPKKQVKPESEVVFTSARHFFHEFVRRETALSDFQAIVVDGLQEDNAYQRVVLAVLRRHFVSRVGVVLCSNKSEDVCIPIQEAFGLEAQDIVQCIVKFPVEVVWKGKPTNRVDACVSAALEFCLKAKDSGGDVLVFLPSLADAFRADALLGHRLNGKDMEVEVSHEVLFGCMGSTFGNGQPLDGCWRVIFAAECPDVIVGMMHVRCVIDSGLMLRTVYRSGSMVMRLAYVSEAEAEERRALAGILDCGTCYRLYSRDACICSPPVDVSESRFLEDIVLRLSSRQTSSVASYLGNVPKTLVRDVKRALQEIGTLDHDGRLTDLGEKLCQTSLEPRLGKLVVGSVGRAPSLDAILLSILAFEDLLVAYGQLKKDGTERSIPASDADSVFSRVIELYKNWVIVPKKMKSTWCELNGVNEAFINRLHSAAQAIQAEFDAFKGRNLCADSIKQENDAKITLGQLLAESFPQGLLQASQKGYKHNTLGDNLHVSPLSLFNSQAEQANDVVCSLYAQVHSEKKLQLLNFSALPDSASKCEPRTSETCVKDMAPKLQKRFGPVGKLIWSHQFSAPRALQSIEEKLRFAADGAKCSLALDSTNQCVLIKGHEKYCLEARQHLEGIVADQVTKLSKKDREAFLTPHDSPYSNYPVSAVLGAGGRVDELLSPSAFRTLIIREIKIPLPEFRRRVNALGDVVQYWLINKDNAFQITYRTAKEADAAYRALFEQRDDLRVFVQGRAHEYRKEQRQRKPAFHAQLSLPRRLCVGIGFAQLADQASFDRIATLLPLRAKLDGSSVVFQRDKKVAGQLYIQGLPPTASQSSVEKLIRTSLSVEPATVCLVHERPRITTQARLEALEDAIRKIFDEALDSGTRTLVLRAPKDVDYTEKGWMSFKDAVAAQSACTLLRGAPIALYSGPEGNGPPLPLTIHVILEETLYFPLQFFQAIQGRLEEELRRQEGLRPEDNIKCDATPCGKAVCVKLKANNLNDFQKTMQLFNSLLLGPQVPHVDAFLRPERVMQVIKATAPGGCIYVYSKPGEKRLVGDAELVSAASKALKKQAKEWETRKRETLQLVGDGVSTLRSFVAAFGDDPWYLAKECKLDAAKFDRRFEVVEIVGTDSAVAQAEDLVRQLPSRRVQAEPAQSPADDRCPVCLEPARPPSKQEAPVPGHRLELCGHWHCEMCLLLALKRATLPLSCFEKDCASPWAIADIVHAANNDQALLSDLARRSFECSSAADTDGRWCPCPTPECHFALDSKADVEDQGVRVLGDVHICPGCTNAVCFRCRSLYHYGMSCAAFRASMALEGTSDKVLKRVLLKLEECDS